ncbi:hypothetical protein FA95DRAFT_1504073, partial [Auriscalpium vulgare]
QLRGQVKTKAQHLVPSHYGLISVDSKVDAEDSVRLLLQKSLFHFRQLDERRGPFGNTIIPALFAAQWLASSKADGAGPYSAHFNPPSLELIALIVTSVECALCDWKTGAKATKGNEFDQDTYQSVYIRHLTSLDKFKKAQPAALATLQRRIWAEAV